MNDFFLIYNLKKKTFMLIKFIFKNEWFNYESSEFEVSNEEYELIIEKSKTFYEDSFELWIGDSFLVFPPEITKKSILEVKIIS